MKNFRSALFAIAAAYLSLLAPVQAQWQVPQGAIPLGRGGGAVGFGIVGGATGMGTKCLFDTSPPSFGNCVSSSAAGVLGQPQYNNGAASFAAQPNTFIVTDLATNVTTAGSTPSTLIVSNPQTLATNLSIPANINLQFTANGRITQGGSFSLTIAGPISAPAQTIFSGFTVGQVTFTYGVTALSEWWGGKGDGNGSNTTGTDNTLPINSAVSATLAGGRVLLLAGGVYNTSGVVNTSKGVAIEGQQPLTTVQSTGAATSAFQFAGVAGAPVNKPVIRNLYIRRATGVTTAGGVCVNLYYTTLAIVENITCENFAKGFVRQRATNSRGTNLLATFVQNLNDWVGFEENGNAAGGDVGHLGNASSVYTDIATAYVGSGLRARGFWTYGETITDQNLTNVVTLGGDTGVDIDLSQAVYANPYTAVIGDYFFSTVVPHGFTNRGIYIHGGTGDTRANINMDKLWIDPGVGTATKNIQLDNVTGLTMTNLVSTNSSNGVLSDGLVMTGNNSLLNISGRFLDHKNPILVSGGTTFSSTFSGEVSNHDAAHIANAMWIASGGNFIRNRFGPFNLTGYATNTFVFPAGSGINTVDGVTVDTSNIGSPNDSASPNLNTYGTNPGMQSVPQGAMGPGSGSISLNSIPYWISGDGRLASGITPGAVGTVLRGTGVGTAPAFAQVNAPTDITGILPVANGGVNQGAATSYTTGLNLTGGGAAGSLAGTYQLLTPKTVALNVKIAITSTGTSVTFTLPNGWTAATDGGLYGREKTRTGEPLSGEISAANGVMSIIQNSTKTGIIPTTGDTYVLQGIISIN